MVKIRFHALTGYSRPGLHIWHKDRPFENRLVHMKATAPEPDKGKGWWRFEVELTRPMPLNFKLFNWNSAGSQVESWENDTFRRVLKVPYGGNLPGEVWLVEGTNRVLFEDPFAHSITSVRIYLITAEKYHNSQIYLWTPAGASHKQDSAGAKDGMPYFDLQLPPEYLPVFNFSFIRKTGEYESEYANRTWSAADGPEIWTHSDGAAISTAAPVKKQLTIHFRHEWGGQAKVRMHVWQDSSDFNEDIEGTPSPDGEWLTYRKRNLYTHIPYGFMFTRSANPQSPSQNPEDWEDHEARRLVTLTSDEEYWTLEGDPTLFDFPPERNQPVAVAIASRDPKLPWREPDFLEVKINQARAPLKPKYQRQPDGAWLFWTYPSAIVSFRFGSGKQLEPCFHRLQPPGPQPKPAVMKVFAVLGRGPCLFHQPPADLFADPPFLITRPGVVEEDGQLRFAIHAPWCARVRLWGEWLKETANPPDLRSTRDGAYWWCQVPVEEVKTALPGQDYHGAKYQFILNDPDSDPANNAINGAKQVQDPAAAWVETSHPTGNSKLVNYSRYHWKNTSWKTPGWEYLIIYQLHPSRFTNRFLGLPPLLQIAREVESGYLRDLGVTAILLMPVNEYQGANGWGYNPSFFYAVESSYGAPEDLKTLVDVCHGHGIAVLLDVVFNHTGCDDNILWEVARESFLDGDTIWGAMPNFDHPQVRHFFAQNIYFWRQEYHVDGFRFDHTKTIIEGHNQDFFSIRRPGSGGGWEFLHYLRSVVKSLDPDCLFMAEQLPNDWAVTNYGGPMDTQWSDSFHDRLVDVCKGFPDQMNAFADALKLSHTACQQWYNVTNYPSSHDEVGNVADRIANIGGLGQGLRRNKAAAAATLLSRGIPMFFMGEEAGETAQFPFNSQTSLDLERYEQNPALNKVREWWKTLIKLRKNNPAIQGPAPLEVHYVEGLVLGFSRGEGKDYYIVCNFGPWPVTRSLRQMNLYDGVYHELLNSTWPAFQVENEDEHTNGGREARLYPDGNLTIPDYGAVILEKIQ
ncbi:MAG: alpha amylase C-terminal domain-containing protein [Firmicutes bacterium]|nr:alpha amylase C-terminal domain-containing protein [Bacillota bacterium]